MTPRPSCSIQPILFDQQMGQIFFGGKLRCAQSSQQLSMKRPFDSSLQNGMVNSVSRGGYGLLPTFLMMASVIAQPPGRGLTHR